MKKIVGILAVVLSVFMLVACGVKEESLDGEYHLYWVASNTGEKHLDGESIHSMKVEGSIMTGAAHKSYELRVDKDRGVIIGEYGREWPYTYKEGALVFDGDEYYKVGSKAYQDKKKEIEDTK
ncbi:LptM family lipoprotein [Streptococcus suis]|uniref:LptM family lipoprotein n=1 Tax=Streptococcus suis TaxID=1307 RepID=UPI0005CF469F|nr:hypothetical protein [Streptococcus suis]NQH21337.1 hypothetical protein [Streptococcus suis]CYV12275.1 Uncharacterised protein [Streptococcus suis]HEL1734897.1 hypothetical protein [Streptococcus suis]